MMLEVDNEIRRKLYMVLEIIVVIIVTELACLYFPKLDLKLVQIVFM